jgi:hypothetical protein
MTISVWLGVCSKKGTALFVALKFKLRYVLSYKNLMKSVHVFVTISEIKITQTVHNKI